MHHKDDEMQSESAQNNSTEEAPANPWSEKPPMGLPSPPWICQFPVVRFIQVSFRKDEVILFFNLFWISMKRYLSNFSFNLLDISQAISIFLSNVLSIFMSQYPFWICDDQTDRIQTGIYSCLSYTEANLIEDSVSFRPFGVFY
jgi:hypothetical protein